MERKKAAEEAGSESRGAAASAAATVASPKAPSRAAEAAPPTPRGRGLLAGLVRRLALPRGSETEQLLLDATEDLHRCHSEKELAEQICRTVDSVLRPSTVHVFLRRYRRYRLIASADRSVEPKVLLPEGFRLPEVLRRRGGARALDTLPGLSADERGWLRSWGCRWAVVIGSPRGAAGPMGLLLYGEPSGDHSEVVRDLLVSLASAAASAWTALLQAERDRLAFELGQGRWLKECPECRRCFDSEVLYCEDDDSRLDATVLLDRRVDGKYLLERKLGHGGMGAVYRARREEGLDSAGEVAVKILVGGDRVALGRFANEARAGRVLRHPGITQVLDHGSLGRQGGYMVMELVEGRTLRAAIDAEAPIGPARVARWFDQIFDAVHHAHSEGVIHRDLKPDNIMVRGEEGGETIKILDFGLAKLRDRASGPQPTLTAAGMVIGTLSYMSPEQLAAEAGSIDHRTDQFALGVMAYEALTGRLPFFSKNLGQMLRAVASQPFRLEVRTSRQAQVAQVLAKALAKEPDDRFADVGRFRAALLAALDGCEPFDPPPGPESPSVRPLTG
ncbi:MAG: serine/threonine protein kinase [Holophagales bacterium]|nr:serine/threonine protein kinase [Holophagales bacterium]